MEITKITFGTSETYLGTFHRIQIWVNNPAEENKWNELVYWNISGYELPKLTDQLIEKLRNLYNRDFPDMLRKTEEEI